MAISAPSLWLPPGVRDQVQLESLVQTPHDIPSGHRSTGGSLLEQEYVQAIESNGFAIRSTEELHKILPSELEKTIQHDIIESALREGVSLPTAVGIANSFINFKSPPPTQSPFRETLHDLATQVEDAIKLRGGRLPRPVYVGEYPWIGFNAKVKRYASGYVIFVHRGLMVALHQAAKIYSWSWMFCEADETEMRQGEPPWTLDETLLALAHLAGEIIQRDATHTPRFRVPSGMRLWLYSATLHAAEIFVLSHEYAHILNDDIPVQDDDSADAIENAADALAWNLLFADVDRSGRVLGGRNDARARIAGVVLIFGLRHLFQQVRMQVFGKKPVYIVSESERAKRFRMFVDRNCDEELLEYFDSCFEWWKSATELVLERCNWSLANPTPSYADVRL